MKMLVQLMLVVVVFFAIPVHALEIVDVTAESNTLSKRWEDDKSKIGVTDQINRGLAAIAGWSGVGQLPGMKPVSGGQPKIMEFVVSNSRILFLHIDKKAIILAKFAKVSREDSNAVIDKAKAHGQSVKDRYTAPPTNNDRNTPPRRRR